METFGGNDFNERAPMVQPLLDWLVRRYPAAKRQNLRRMVQAGRVLINGRPARTLRDTLPPDAEIKVLDRPHPGEKEVPGEFEIVFEDRDLLVVAKPPGLLTSTVPKEPRPTLLAQVRQYLARTEPRARVGLIHRLDRDASGLLIFSKTDRAYRSLKTQFFKHTVEREYAAVVYGSPDPPKGQISSRLVERASGVVYSTRQRGRGEPAITEFQVVRAGNERSLLRVTLHTGRKHQIRVHLSELGHPIVGDVVYGKKDANEPRLLLAAIRLTITHPVTGLRMTFQTPVPPEFAPP
jgi:23S rRNA pseudouridine1911/1915/1917 synthase